MINIDMEMPESCEDCRFLLHIDNKATCYASVKLQEVNDIEIKPVWCPLIECELCGSVSKVFGALSPLLENK